MFRQQAVNRIGGVDVQTPDRVGGHQHRGSAGDLPAHQHLLHIAAGHPADGEIRAGGHHLQVLPDPQGQFVGVLAVEEHAPALFPGAEHHVSRHAHGPDQTHAQPVLGDEGHGDPGLANLHGSFAHKAGRRLPVRSVKDFSLTDQTEAGDGLQQLLLAGPGDAGHAQNLAAHGGEGNAVQFFDSLAVQNGEVPDLQPLHGLFVPGAVDVQGDGVAHHHIRESLGICLAGPHGADVLALAKDRHLVGKGHDLMELVGNDDNGFSVGLHGPEDIEELVRLLGGEDGGGLVQNQNAGSPVEDLDDFHRLFLGDGHVVDFLAGVDVEAVLFADGPDLLLGGLHVQPALFLQAQDDVLRGGEHIYQLVVLVNHADAVGKSVLGGADGDGFAVYEDLALVGEVDAGEHVHQRGFAAAVLSQ